MTYSATQPVLSECEWRLVAELLRAEREELPVEIRHTDSPHVHEELQERMRTVNEVLRKIEDASTAAEVFPGDQTEI